MGRGQPWLAIVAGADVGRHPSDLSSEDIERGGVGLRRIEVQVVVGQAVHVLHLHPFGRAVEGGLDHAAGRVVLRDRGVLQRGAHVVDPDRQGGLATVFAVTQRAEVVAADPHGGHVRAAETGEPGVAVVVGGAGLATHVLAAEHLGLDAGTALDHVAHHRHQLVGGAGVDRARGGAGIRVGRYGSGFGLGFGLGCCSGVHLRRRGTEVETVHDLVDRLVAAAGALAAGHCPRASRPWRTRRSHGPPTAE
ncbi:hypothetical protein G6F65_017409 [Rhizopus arrhizus]|nr:hypothetical protein G6F65_017409 [Rhizopus arrhizus]